MGGQRDEQRREMGGEGTERKTGGESDGDGASAVRRGGGWRPPKRGEWRHRGCPGTEGADRVSSNASLNTNGARLRLSGGGGAR